MGEPTHAYRSHAMQDDYCEQLLPHDSSKGTEWIACGLPRSAHPASPPEPLLAPDRYGCAICGRDTVDCDCFPPEPAPESDYADEIPGERPHTEGLEPTRPDPAPEPRSKEWWIEKARREGDATIGAGVAAPEPVDVAKAIVEWLDQNVSKCQHGYITVSCGECMGRYLK